MQLEEAEARVTELEKHLQLLISFLYDHLPIFPGATEHPVLKQAEAALSWTPEEVSRWREAVARAARGDAALNGKGPKHGH